MAIFRYQFFFRCLHYLLDEYEIVDGVNHKRTEKNDRIMFACVPWTMARVIASTHSTQFLSNESNFQVSLSEGKDETRNLHFTGNPSLFWGCKMNIFSGIARRPSFDFRHLIQKPLWNRKCSTSKFKNYQRINSSWEQQNSSEKNDFPEAGRKK